MVINMAFTLTTINVHDETGIDLEGEDINKVASFITKATTEVQNRTSREFDDDDSDITTVKRAISFLTSYYIRRKNKESSMAKMDLADYYRELKEFHGDITPKERNAWTPKISVLTNTEMLD